MASAAQSLCNAAQLAAKQDVDERCRRDGKKIIAKYPSLVGTAIRCTIVGLGRFHFLNFQFGSLAVVFTVVSDWFQLRVTDLRKTYFWPQLSYLKRYHNFDKKFTPPL